MIIFNDLICKYQFATFYFKFRVHLYLPHRTKILRTLMLNSVINEEVVINEHKKILTKEIVLEQI